MGILDKGPRLNKGTVSEPKKGGGANRTNSHPPVVASSEGGKESKGRKHQGDQPLLPKGVLHQRSSDQNRGQDQPVPIRSDHIHRSDSPGRISIKNGIE